MYCGHACLCVCLYVSVCVFVCLSVCPRPYAYTDVTWGMVEAVPSCALLGGFANGKRVALLWQHNVNPSYKLASIPRYDDIVLGGVCERCWPVTSGWWGTFSKLRAIYGKWAWLAGRWPAVASQHYCGGLDCGLPLEAFWQHNANAKC